MQNFGINFKDFFETYFAENDEAFLTNLGEIISEKDDSKEIAALADWSFRNYIIDALTIALELNNEKICNDFIDMLQGASRTSEREYERRDREYLPPPPTPPAAARRAESAYPPPARGYEEPYAQPARGREDPYAPQRGYEEPYTPPARGREDPYAQRGYEEPARGREDPYAPQRGYDDPYAQPAMGHEDPYGPMSRRGADVSQGVPPLPRPAREELLSPGYRGMPEIREIRDLKKMSMFSSKDDSGDEEDPPPDGQGREYKFEK
jgi:hypothetical protein